MNVFSIAILAGGKSSRMGRNKALVEIAGKPIIEHIIQRTQLLGQCDTFLITNSPAAYSHLNLMMYADIYPNCGALGGIHSALQHSKSEHVVVIACDMPFISTDFITYMFQEIGDNDAVVPHINEQIHGLHAIYHRRCASIIQQQIEQENLKVRELFQHLTVKYLDEDAIMRFNEDGLALLNINTPQDLAQAKQKYNP